MGKKEISIVRVYGVHETGAVVVLGTASCTEVDVGLACGYPGGDGVVLKNIAVHEGNWRADFDRADAGCECGVSFAAGASDSSNPGDSTWLTGLALTCRSVEQDSASSLLEPEQARININRYAFLTGTQAYMDNRGRREAVVSVVTLDTDEFEVDGKKATRLNVYFRSEGALATKPVYATFAGHGYWGIDVDRLELAAWMTALTHPSTRLDVNALGDSAIFLLAHGS